MLTAHASPVREVTEGASPRSQAAAFAAVLAKPFDLDELPEVVARAVGGTAPFDASPAAETARTAALVANLTAAGVGDVRTSTRREWANFYAPDGVLGMLYWSAATASTASCGRRPVAARCARSAASTTSTPRWPWRSVPFERTAPASPSFLTSWFGDHAGTTRCRPPSGAACPWRPRRRAGYGSSGRA